MNKIFWTLTGIISLFVVTSCCQQKTVTTSDIKEPNNDVKKEVLLEVNTQLEGMLYPSGNILEIRVYSTGEAEFENFEKQPEDAFSKSDSNIVSRKSTLLSKDDFLELKSLIEMSDIKNSKSQYSPTISLSDASIKKIIKIKSKNEEKIIKIKENDTTLHLDRKKEVYPESLINILNLTTKLRVKLDFIIL